MTNSILAPIPKEHIECAYTMRDKDFICFGSDNFEFFEKVRPGTKVYIYVSKSHGEIGYIAEYHSTTKDVSKMKEYNRNGHRPPSTINDSACACYWMINRIEKLERPMKISDFQSAKTRKSLKSTYTPRTAILVS